MILEHLNTRPLISNVIYGKPQPKAIHKLAPNGAKPTSKWDELRTLHFQINKQVVYYKMKTSSKRISTYKREPDIFWYFVNNF